MRLYSDSPRIIIVSVTPGAQGGVTEEYDLRRDWLFGLARDASADALVVDRKIWFAALEGALEHESVARDLATAGEDGSAVVSTSSLLTAEGVVALGPSDLNRLSQLTSDPEKAARLGAALRAGNVLAVPRAVLAPGPGGWWEIAAGGDARAVLDDDLNMARSNESGIPKGGTNSSGGAKQISTPKTITIKTPTPAPQGRFGKVTTPEEWAARRAAMKKQRAAGLEAALITAVMIVAVIGALWELSRVWTSTFGKAAEQLDVIDRASGAGR